LLIHKKVEMKKNQIVNAVTFFALLNFIGHSFAEENYNPEQIKTLLSDKKLIIENEKGGLFDMQMNSDFTAHTTAAGGDVGNWRLSEKGFCMTWKKIRANTERCFRVSKDGFNHYIINPDGSKYRIMKFQ